MDEALVVCVEFRGQLREYAEERYSAFQIYAFLLGFPIMYLGGRIMQLDPAGANLFGWVGLGIIFGGMLLTGFALHAMLNVHSRHYAARRLMPLSERLIKKCLEHPEQNTEETPA